MGTTKLIGKKMVMHKGKYGTEMQVLETEQVDRPDPCKECYVEPREHGSRRCRKCMNKFHQQKAADKKITDKIAAKLSK